MRTYDLIILKVLHTVSQRQPVAPPKQTTTHKPRNMFFWLSWEIALQTANFGSNTYYKPKLAPPPSMHHVFAPSFFILLFFFKGTAGLRLTVTQIEGQPCLSIAARMAQMHLKESMRLSDGAERWNIRLLLVFSAAACQVIATPVVIYPRVPSDKV